MPNKEKNTGNTFVFRAFLTLGGAVLAEIDKSLDFSNKPRVLLKSFEVKCFKQQICGNSVKR